ncbi:MAG: phosphoesterase [Planctomycetota bacterium]
MSTVAEEQVLVVPTPVFHEIGHFEGFSDEVDRYLPQLLDCGQLSYRPRGEMEQDPSFKQLIPYAVFRYVEADGTVTLFQYQRGGGVGEARLRAKRSVGVGGHISTLDADAVANSPGGSADVYRQGLQRELAEEVIVESPSRESCIGLINDDLTDVGKVHLGVVHVFDLEQPAVSPREDDIQNASFQPLAKIAAELDGFESWSQIVVRALVDRS